MELITAFFSWKILPVEGESCCIDHVHEVWFLGNGRRPLQRQHGLMMFSKCIAQCLVDSLALSAGAGLYAVALMTL